MSAPPSSSSRRGVADGSIVGHIGFHESINLIAHAFGWKIDRIEETRAPIVTSVDRETPCVKVAPATCAAAATSGGATAATSSRSSSSTRSRSVPRPKARTRATTSRSSASPNISMANQPEIPGGKGTYASVGNYMPLIGDARPGIVTVVDMPLPRFWAPDPVREHSHD